MPGKYLWWSRKLFYIPSAAAQHMYSFLASFLSAVGNHCPPEHWFEKDQPE